MTHDLVRNKLILLCCACALFGCEERKKSKAEERAPVATIPAPLPAPPPGPVAGKSRCPRVMKPVVSGKAEGPRLLEISGMVASFRSPGVLWVHNDSGDGARVYALDERGHHIGTVELPLQALDWEDIALERRSAAPDRIYVADSGDNFEKRDGGISVHRFEEPDRAALAGTKDKPLQARSVETMKLHYPDGPHDAEALLVDSKSGELVIITKPRLAYPEIYAAKEFSPERTLEHRGVMDTETIGVGLHLVTGADSSLDEKWVIVRTYNDIVVFPRASGQSIVDALLGKACPIQAAREAQGEAIGFLNRALSPGSTPKFSFPEFVTVGEGTDQPLHLFRAARPKK